MGRYMTYDRDLIVNALRSQLEYNSRLCWMCLNLSALRTQFDVLGAVEGGAVDG